MIKIEELTETECKELLKRIKGIVEELPSFIDTSFEGCYSMIGDPYHCCSGSTCTDHAKNCAVNELRNIFGY